MKIKDKKLNELSKICHKMSNDNGRSKDRNLGEQLMLIVTELSEAMESYRKQDEGEFKDGIADTFISLFDLCGGRGINIEEELERKINFNRKRYKK
jgi:NTP pyrophosphatase (non-canonical NTP hydrolase)